MIQPSLFWVLTQENWSQDLKGIVRISRFVGGALFKTAKMVGTTQVPMSRFMDEESVMCPYNGIIFSLSKEGSPASVRTQTFKTSCSMK